eukprot:8249404-Pyramimonas_sp.AAC.1
MARPSTVTGVELTGCSLGALNNPPVHSFAVTRCLKPVNDADNARALALLAPRAASLENSSSWAVGVPLKCRSTSTHKSHDVASVCTLTIF